MTEGGDDDGDSLDELIDLLRASSESHGDDDSAWEIFRQEITQRRLDYLKGEDLRKVRCRTAHISHVVNIIFCPVQLILMHIYAHDFVLTIHT